ncbi:MAG: glycosyltransferase [Clostridia bacterium]
MRILYISYIKIKSWGGAVIEADKFIDGIESFAKNQKNCEYKIISLDNNLENTLPNVVLNPSKALSVLSRLLGHSYYMYMFWRLNKKKILAYKPDVVVLGRSNLGFIAKSIKKYSNSIKVVTDVDNIEIDYINAFSNNSTSLSIKQLKKTTYRDENDTIKYSDHLLMLTPRNLSRVKELYGYSSDNNSVLPICMDKPIKPLEINTQCKNVVFYGSLSYPANNNAICDFINNVWKENYKSNKNIKLIVAGSSPQNQLLELVSKYENIVVYKNYSELKDVIPKNSLLIVPLKDGAGMKTKIVEALSFGLTVVASDEALEGYEEIMNPPNKGVTRANAVNEYIEAINMFMKLDETELVEQGKENYKLFEKFYSYERSRKVFANILKK